jgi:hypothetical protein
LIYAVIEASGATVTLDPTSSATVVRRGRSMRVFTGHPRVGHEHQPLQPESEKRRRSTGRVDVSFTVNGFTLVSLLCTPGTEDPVDITLATPGSTMLSYDGSQFHLNWQTPKGAGKCYRMTMTARDGSQLTAFFKTK